MRHHTEPGFGRFLVDSFLAHSVLEMQQRWSVVAEQGK